MVGSIPGPAYIPGALTIPGYPGVYMGIAVGYGMP
eukprot:CAMPEP_0181379040 /NCGR_PEP_ID=MMETSP1106-20121128/18789_1 /TAXON_ID=81844 /ORGANISM="Mantoniella antarctica, Strain SL-175" /LENGTH=34 /DNA_ID= /DNA_START= /DNA_END= /DNA_ORIENTATION=